MTATLLRTRPALQTSTPVKSPWHCAPANLGGEMLHVPERLVVSPCAGVFQPAGTDIPEVIDVGFVIGRVAGQEVRSAFAGRFMALLAVPGERLRPGQPIAWLRAS